MYPYDAEARLRMARERAADLARDYRRAHAVGAKEADRAAGRRRRYRIRRRHLERASA